jgi:hypothetical protein
MTKGVIPKADLQKNCLNYTSYYYETSKTYPEFHGVTASSFDGAGLSHGVIQFNFISTTLQPIWKDLINNYPIQCYQAFDQNDTFYNTWKNNILTMTTSQLISWGLSIGEPTNLHKCIEPWNSYFRQLGIMKESIDRQMVGVQPYFSSTEIWKSKFGVWSRRGYALLFDIAVQSGSISTSTQDLIMSDIAKIDPKQTREQIETAKLIIIANRRADAVGSTYQQSYRDRKLAIAKGSGYVYGGFVDTTPYDLLLEPAFDTDVVAAPAPAPPPPPQVPTLKPEFILINHNVVGI